jgi:Zinc-binding dehydrogenase
VHTGIFIPPRHESACEQVRLILKGTERAGPRLFQTFADHPERGRPHPDVVDGGQAVLRCFFEARYFLGLVAGRLVYDHSVRHDACPFVILDKNVFQETLSLRDVQIGVSVTTLLTIDIRAYESKRLDIRLVGVRHTGVQKMTTPDRSIARQTRQLEELEIATETTRQCFDIRVRFVAGSHAPKNAVSKFGARRLPVVYDSVGKDTFMKSLVRPPGLMVSFGQSSGPVGPVDLGIFAQKGSLFFTRPTLNTYAAARGDQLAMAKDLFDVVLSGAVKIEINQTFPLKEAAQAHRDLESRKTVGSTVFTV